MRRTPRTLLLAATLAASGLLVACTPGGAEPTPSATSDAPRFASEEEALAAAEEVYGKYVEATARLAASGGIDAEPLRPFVSEALFQDEVDSYQQFTENGWTGSGTRTFTIRLQRFSDDEIAAYTCEDFTETDVVDSTGKSIVPADRDPQIAYEILFEASDSLRITKKEIWSGGGVC